MQFEKNIFKDFLFNQATQLVFKCMYIFNGILIIIIIIIL